MRKHIEALRKKRNGHLDAMTALSELAANENRLFTADEQKAFDKDQAEVTDIDAQIVRFELAEKQIAGTAKPAPDPTKPQQTAEVVPFKAFPGQSFTRFVGALALSKGNLMQAAEFAKRWEHQTPEVYALLKHAVHVGNTNDPQAWLQRAAVAVGTTTDPVWAAPLVQYTHMTSEFIELLRAATVFNLLRGFTPIPFNVKIPRQTAGASAGWVGEGLSKPVSRLTFDDVTVPWAKIAVIVVITQELARFSSPSAEMLVRNDLIAAIAEFIDKQLLDDTVTAVAGVRPASITNAAHKVPSTGSTVAAVTKDLADAMLYMTNANIPLRSPVWIMSPASAMFLATLRTAQDVFAFPGMGMGSTGTLQPPIGSPPTGQGVQGLSLLGIPVITSTAMGDDIVLLEQSQLMVADDGEVLIDTSTEASVQMDSAPATPPTPLVSFWQQNLLGIKAERFIYWLMRRVAGVVEITGFPAAGP
ncbi:MAG TPA: phage major capsid protein [Reyranella sp.]|nr:phage major capsid protein [Reyranella sp.]